MSPVATSTPPGTQAAILNAAIEAKHSWEHPNLAHRFGLTLVELQALLKANGYPDVQRMRLRIQALAEDAAAAVETAPEPEQADLDPAGQGGSHLESVLVEHLHADPNNPRSEITDVEDLADSIKSVGLLQPIVARRDGSHLVVVAGHRRLAAVRHLRWTHVDVIVRAPMRPDHVLAAMLIENGQRAGLDPIEEARALHKLKHDHGFSSDSALGELVGRNQVYVSGRLALLSLSAEDQEQVRAGQMKLVEARHRGRLNSGKVRKTGVSKNWHLGPQHPLAARVKARCIRLEHSRGRTVGGMGCGECWEEVVRADERTRLLEASHDGPCPTCGTENHR